MYLNNKGVDIATKKKKRCCSGEIKKQKIERKNDNSCQNNGYLVILVLKSTRMLIKKIKITEI